MSVTFFPEHQNLNLEKRTQLVKREHLVKRTQLARLKRALKMRKVTKKLLSHYPKTAREGDYNWTAKKAKQQEKILAKRATKRVTLRQLGKIQLSLQLLMEKKLHPNL